MPDHTELLVTMAADVAATRAAMGALSETVTRRFDKQDERLDDHEKRIGAGERWQSGMGGRLIAWGTIGAAAVAVIVSRVMPVLLTAIGLRTP